MVNSCEKGKRAERNLAKFLRGYAGDKTGYYVLEEVQA